MNASTDPRTTATPMLEYLDVVKSFGSGSTEVRAVTDVTLSVDAGQFVAVMGPSGCGKSTLLHLAGALEQPSAGRVLVDGRDLAEMSAPEQAELRRNDVGYVFQSLNLIPALTALENVMLPLELDGTSSKKARVLARDVLEQVGLNHHLDRYPDDFSGGQRQRIAIARAVIGNRRLLLADEPTGALDTVNGDQVVELLATLARDRGVAVVMVTHDPRFASWTDRVVFLRDGRIVDESAPVFASTCRVERSAVVTLLDERPDTDTPAEHAGSGGPRVHHAHLVVEVRRPTRPTRGATPSRDARSS